MKINNINNIEPDYKSFNNLRVNLEDIEKQVGSNSFNYTESERIDDNQLIYKLNRLITDDRMEQIEKNVFVESLKKNYPKYFADSNKNKEKTLKEKVKIFISAYMNAVHHARVQEQKSYDAITAQIINGDTYKNPYFPKRNGMDWIDDQRADALSKNNMNDNYKYASSILAGLERS